MNNLICISRKTLYFISLLFLLIFIAVLIGFVNKKNLSYKAEANVLDFSCSEINKYEVQDRILLNEWVNDCKLKYGQSPAWNGSYGFNAKCYSQTAICANIKDCIKHDCLTGCLYEKVSIDICIRFGTAPKEVKPENFSCPIKGNSQVAYSYKGNCYLTNSKVAGYDEGKKPYCKSGTVDYSYCCKSGSTDPKCPKLPTVIPTAQPIQVACSGQTCNGTTIGSCPQGYLRRCTCVNNLARFVDDKSCGSSVTPVVAKCYYGGNSVTEVSKYWYDKSYHFCIRDSLNYLVGARCQSSNGVLVNGNAIDDAVTCPKPIIGACIRNDSKWKTDKTTCEYGKNKYLPYGQCLPGNYKCKCDDKAKYNYPTLQIDASCGT